MKYERLKYFFKFPYLKFLEIFSKYQRKFELYLFNKFYKEHILKNLEDYVKTNSKTEFVFTVEKPKSLVNNPEGIKLESSVKRLEDSIEMEKKLESLIVEYLKNSTERYLAKTKNNNPYNIHDNRPN